MLKFSHKNEYICRIAKVLILLLIAGQSLAVSAQCKIKTTDHDMSSSQTLDSNDPHAGHDMNSMTQSMNMGSTPHSEMSGCCDLDCQCTQNTCSSSNSMITNAVQSEFDHNNHSSFFDENKLIYFLASSALYRPPITC